MELNFTNKQQERLDAIGVSAYQLNKHGYIVSRPLNDVEYDLVIDDGNKLSKVYARTSWSSKNNGPLIIDLRRSTNKNYDYLYVCGSMYDYLIPEEAIAGKSTIVLGESYEMYRLPNLTMMEEIYFLKDRFKELSGKQWHSHLNINCTGSSEIETAHERLIDLYEMSELFEENITMARIANDLTEHVVCINGLDKVIGWVVNNGLLYLYYHNHKHGDIGETGAKRIFKGKFDNLYDLKLFVFKHRNKTLD